MPAGRNSVMRPNLIFPRLLAGALLVLSTGAALANPPPPQPPPGWQPPPTPDGGLPPPFGTPRPGMRLPPPPPPAPPQAQPTATNAVTTPQPAAVTAVNDPNAANTNNASNASGSAATPTQDASAQKNTEPPWPPPGWDKPAAISAASVVNAPAGTPIAKTVSTAHAKSPEPAAPEMASKGPSARSLSWLLLPILAAVLCAWWISLRRSRALAHEAAHLSRQQRVLESAHRNLKEKSQQLRQLSTQDPLTGVLNRLAFGSELRERLDHLARYNQPLNLVMFDLDHFKTINDKLGHSAGDRALTLVAGIVREHLVSDDLFGRFGGDEFMIACAGQSLDATAEIANAIRTAVLERALLVDPPLPGLSLSMGVAQANAETGYAAATLFERADAALYRAKQNGRNNVVVADERVAPVPESAAVVRHL